MKVLPSLRALGCALFVFTAASAWADSSDNKGILSASYDSATKVITISGSKLASSNKPPVVSFNGVSVPATYNPTTGKVLATLPAADETINPQTPRPSGNLSVRKFGQGYKNQKKKLDARAAGCIH